MSSIKCYTACKTIKISFLVFTKKSHNHFKNVVCFP